MRAIRAWFALAASLLTYPALAEDERAPRLHMIGDSTMADKPVWPSQPERGWGQLLPLYFSEPGRVVNHAKNGRSTKSFIDEGSWEWVRAQLRPGDWLIIQFGHNDEKQEKPLVYAAPRGAYQDNLRKFIAQARQAGSTPVLATSIARRRFDDAGQLIDTHGEYPSAMREVAAEEQVPLLELNRLSSELLRTYGAERSKELFLWIPETDYQTDGTPTKRQGWRDDTHLSALGASRVAELAIGEFLRLDLELKSWIKTSPRRENRAGAAALPVTTPQN